MEACSYQVFNLFLLIFIFIGYYLSPPFYLKDRRDRGISIIHHLVYPMNILALSRSVSESAGVMCNAIVWEVLICECAEAVLSLSYPACLCFVRFLISS